MESITDTFPWTKVLPVYTSSRRRSSCEWRSIGAVVATERLVGVGIEEILDETKSPTVAVAVCVLVAARGKNTIGEKHAIKIASIVRDTLCYSRRWQLYRVSTMSKAVASNIRKANVKNTEDLQLSPLPAGLKGIRLWRAGITKHTSRALNGLRCKYTSYRTQRHKSSIFRCLTRPSISPVGSGFIIGADKEAGTFVVADGTPNGTQNVGLSFARLHEAASSLSWRRHLGPLCRSYLPFVDFLHDNRIIFTHI